MRQNKTNILKQLSKLIALVALFSVASIMFRTTKVHAAPTTFTVINTNDSGSGSLRQAITDANNNNNASEMDVIDFNIPGGGVKVISPTSDLPVINQKVTINASTQPGADCSTHTLMVRLDGGAAGNTDGLRVSGNDSSGSIIKGLSITNFTYSGLFIVDSNDNLVVCNNFGIQEDGDTVGPNMGLGIVVQGTSTNTVIGGSSLVDRNIVSGNNIHGIGLYEDSSDTYIWGNYIGIDATGLVARPNGASGVNSGDSSTNNHIGGSVSGQGNVISGNAADGLQLHSGVNIIKGNFIGTNAAGTAAVPNLDNGIGLHDATADNQVGGSSATERNIISGNNHNGIILTNNGSSTIYGNYIGTDVSGSFSIANSDNGIVVDSATTGNVIGGPLSGQRNVVSGNTRCGIVVNIGTNTLQGNYIGTNVSGDLDIPNQEDGIVVGANSTNNIIGGSSVGMGNVISGNTGMGINLNGSDGNIIYGNIAGYGADASTVIPNNAGIICGGDNNIIGGQLAGQSNILSGNGLAGMVIIGSNNQVTSNVISENSAVGILLNSTNNIVSHNTITDNAAYGIGVLGSDNSIVSNTISGSSLAVMVFGITAAGYTPVGNTISNNSISNISVAGIDLNENTSIGGGYFPDTNIGPTPNDPLDADVGPNDYLNTPVITTASESASNTIVNFKLDVPVGSYRIEFFNNTAADPSGFGQGETPIGYTTVTSSGTGEETFTATLTGTGYTNISSTTTEDLGGGNLGSTSEFGNTFSDITTSSTDQDSITSEVEQASPNNGDGNNDGIPDSQQSNVTSLPTSDGTYVTLALPEGTTISSTTVDALSTLSTKDIAYSYPLGLVSFTATTTQGATVPVQLFFYTNQQANTFTPRKYNPTTQTYTTLSSLTPTTLTDITIGTNNTHAVKLAYSITDGGTLDQDNQANGTIIDPVGLAQATVGVPNTGL